MIFQKVTVQKLDLEDFRKIMADDFGQEACKFLYDYYDRLSAEYSSLSVDPVRIWQRWVEYRSLEEARQDNERLDECDYYKLESGRVLVDYCS